MGGKVLEYEAKTIKREGIEQGENKLCMLMENGRSQDAIRVTQKKDYEEKDLLPLFPGLFWHIFFYNGIERLVNSVFTPLLPAF